MHLKIIKIALIHSTRTRELNQTIIGVMNANKVGKIETFENNLCTIFIGLNRHISIVILEKMIELNLLVNFDKSYKEQLKQI